MQSKVLYLLKTKLSAENYANLINPSPVVQRDNEVYHINDSRGASSLFYHFLSRFPDETLGERLEAEMNQQYVGGSV